MQMQQRVFELWSSFGASELALITDFVSRSTALQADCVKDICRKYHRCPQRSADPAPMGRETQRWRPNCPPVLASLRRETPAFW
jgi:hypothetical protein